jgi:hypothetical protein
MDEVKELMAQIEREKALPVLWSREREAQLRVSLGAALHKQGSILEACQQWAASLGVHPTKSALHNLRVVQHAVGNGAAADTLQQLKTAVFYPPEPSRPIIAIYTGYSGPFTGKDVQGDGVWGSELAAIKLGEELSLRQCDVTIFCECAGMEAPERVRGVAYLPCAFYGEWAKWRRVELLIVSRFLHFFLEFDATTAAKTVLWLHDKVPHYLWRPCGGGEMALPSMGAPLFANVLPALSGIVCVSEWQAAEVVRAHPKAAAKVRVIGNALNWTWAPPGSVEDRVPGRMIFCTDPARGLDVLLLLFARVRAQVPHATLHVYWSALPAHVVLPEGATFMGKASGEQLRHAMCAAQVMAYPNLGHETYCMAALEAQAAGVVVVAREYSGLCTTVGDRGILIPGDDVRAPEWQDAAVGHIVRLMSDASLRASYSAVGAAWACTQTWAARAEEWERVVMRGAQET